MRFHHFLIGCFILLVSCHPSQQISKVQYAGYTIASNRRVDSTYINMLSSYSDSVNKTMNEYLVQNERDLNKDVPNSTLGNFLADAYLWAAKNKVDPRAEMAFMNHGGVRINRLAQGNTHIFNSVVIINVCVAFCSHSEVNHAVTSNLIEHVI